jgi:hypothetical protein
MNFNYQESIPESLHSNSKVWVYQSSRLFTINEALQLENKLSDFTVNWESHGAAVKGYTNLFFGRFIVFMADDTDSRICGRAIDAVARYVKEIENEFAVNLMDRHTLAFFIKDKVEMLPMSQLNYAVENNFINASTLYFNNLVTTKSEFLTKWITPVSETWLMKKIQSVVS